MGLEDIPDAPWIREAERWGAPPFGPEDEDVFCPICGKIAERIYLDQDGEAFGCDQCIQVKDAYEWEEENRR